MNLKDSVSGSVGIAMYNTVWQRNSISVMDHVAGDAFNSVYRSVYTVVSPSCYFAIHKYMMTYEP